MKDIFDQVKSIPIEKVIGDIISLKHKGGYCFGLCPFHNDTSEGSFVVTPQRGTWKCFACSDSYSGDSIDFVGKYYGLSFKEAVLKIANDYGVVDSEEHDKQLMGPVVLELNKKEKKKKKKASPEMLDLVYRLFIELASLDKKDEQILKNTRGLSDEECKMFFTWPSDPDQFTDQLIEKLADKNIDQSFLSLVPGFFYHKLDERWRFTRYHGIGFPILDKDGYIAAIQIRKNNYTKMRYVWFSSSFADKEDNSDEICILGTASGSPIDVCFPNKKPHNVIAITEGKFKALALSRLGLTSLSMQGITSWRKILPEIKSLLSRFDNPEIWLCFDADIFTNEKVRESAENLKKTIVNANLNCQFVYWHPKYGKGIDDVLINQHKDKIKRSNELPRKKTAM